MFKSRIWNGRPEPFRPIPGSTQGPLQAKRASGIVDSMNTRIRSTTVYWWALGIIGAFALTLVVLLLVGVLEREVWWTAAAMTLLAVSNAFSIRTIARNNRRLMASRGQPEAPAA